MRKRAFELALNEKIETRARLESACFNNADIFHSLSLYISSPKLNTSFVTEITMKFRWKFTLYALDNREAASQNHFLPYFHHPIAAPPETETQARPHSTARQLIQPPRCSIKLTLLPLIFQFLLLLLLFYFFQPSHINCDSAWSFIHLKRLEDLRAVLQIFCRVYIYNHKCGYNYFLLKAESTRCNQSDSLKGDNARRLCTSGRHICSINKSNMRKLVY